MIKHKNIEHLINGWQFIIDRAKSENGITSDWNEHQNSYIQGMQCCLNALKKYEIDNVSSSVNQMNAKLFYKLTDEIGFTHSEGKQFLQGLRLMESLGFQFTVPEGYLLPQKEVTTDV